MTEFSDGDIRKTNGTLKCDVKWSSGKTCMKRSVKTLNIGEDGIHEIVGKFWYGVQSSNAEENGKFVHLSMEFLPYVSMMKNSNPKNQDVEFGLKVYWVQFVKQKV